MSKTKLQLIVRKVFLCFSMLFFSMNVLKAQLKDDFNDGNFSNNPGWAGGTADFIVNASSQLQSNNTIANTSFFISTANSLGAMAQWEMYVRIAFNPSSANYIDVYLTASDADLSLNTTTGYFVRIGNTDDEISLYRKDANGSITKIIDGANGVLNNSNNVIKIKVIRDAANQWILNRDLTGTGNTYITEGSFTDATYTSSAFFGFLIKQSTSSFFQKHYFDDIEIKNYVPDITPPSIQSASAVSSTAADILFNKPIESVSGQDVINYSVNNGLGNPASVTMDATNHALVHLNFATPFANGVGYTLLIKSVKDLAGNEIVNGNVIFSFYTPQKYDVVIDEIMADPSPTVALADNEWIELRNTSSFTVNLQGWRLADATGQSGPMPNFMLQPDSLLIVCASSAAAPLSPYGNVIGVSSFPSLGNDGDLIYLISSLGKTIHAVQYTPGWYQNELKKNGGWTLEMIDTKNPCIGMSNWKASKDSKGGTPGKKNSMDGINKDETAPKLLRAFAKGTDTITLIFNEPLDSLKAASINNYLIDNGVSVAKAITISPVFDKVNIALNSPMVPGTIHTITANDVTDCQGNTITSVNTARFGIAQQPENRDIVINEILYNPKPGGVDYVELYNRSEKIIDLSKIYIANRNSSNTIGSIEQATAESVLLFPGDFMVLTSDPAAVRNQYITTNPDAFSTVSSMPSFPDDGGIVVILNVRGEVVDEVNYSDKWQFALVANTEGVSLERIDFNGPSSQSNFHSAATSSGYGTPGYKNSQYRLSEDIIGTIKISPDIFSPDNDGVDDFAVIDYNFPTPGYVANITIFDASGRRVRYLQQNALSGIKGNYRWDGLDDKNRKLPQGIYIIYTEIFNTAGRKKQFKNTIVLARRY
ncbi:MAG: lamin tail domain-containing protein [Bacteroidota bacterium]|nr:lamin tail domain-containing protein [Bacteroidota bacterium]